MEGYYDQYATNIIQNGGENPIRLNFTNSTDRNNIFLPMLSFRLYDSFSTYSEDSSNKDIFSIFDMSGKDSHRKDLSIKNISEL